MLRLLMLRLLTFLAGFGRTRGVSVCGVCVCSPFWQVLVGPTVSQFVACVCAGCRRVLERSWLSWRLFHSKGQVARISHLLASATASISATMAAAEQLSLRARSPDSPASASVPPEQPLNMALEREVQQPIRVPSTPSTPSKDLPEASAVAQQIPVCDGTDPAASTGATTCDADRKSARPCKLAKWQSV